MSAQTRRYLLTVSATDPNGYSASDQAVVMVTPELSKKLRGLRDEFLRLQKVVPNFYELRSYDYTPEVVDTDETPEDNRPWTEFDVALNGDYVEVDSERLLAFTELNLSYCMMCVREDGVKWEFVPKHTSVVHTTGTLPFEIFAAKRKKKRAKKRPRTLEDLLDVWAVHAPGMWDNETGPLDWFAVSNEGGIVAYFGKESDALRFRLAQINRELNG